MGKIAINIATGTLQQEEIIVGIDLGTTNSLVAIVHPETQQPIALKEIDGNSIVPSIIHFNKNGNIEVGEPARQFLLSDPERTIYSIKRLLGKSLQEVNTAGTRIMFPIVANSENGMLQVKIDNEYFSPVDLSALILKELKQRAEHVLKTPVNKAVITVPAYFDDGQRQATKDAGKLAGLEVLRIVNEPTAASLAYGIGLDRKRDSTVAVFDLGGGTFDISILNISDGIFEVVATNGDTNLGGDDIDDAIVQYWLEKFLHQSEYATDSKLAQELRLAAEDAKKQMGPGNFYEREIAGVKLHLDKEAFIKILQPFIDKTITRCGAALKDAGLEISAIESVVMVGGSTRILEIRNAVASFFDAPLHTDHNPDEIVAWGAAIQANILAGKSKDVLLLDVTPLSLGVETAGGLMDVVVPRNAKIPSSAARQYTTQADGQTGMNIAVYQGERDLVKDNRRLGEFILKGIPAMPAGLAKVEIKFMLNADGVLTVSAKELRSGVAQEIEIQSQYGLSDTQVEEMLLDSMTNAKDDIAARALAEATTEAEQLLKTTERFLQKNISSLSTQETMQTANAMQALQMALTMADKNLIVSKTEELNDISRPYAERIMDGAIAEAMKGKSV